MVDGLENVENVEQQYSWRGELIAYRVDTLDKHMHIPVSGGNRHYRFIKQMIDEGKCKELPPEFGRTFEVIGQKGKITGHDTDRGFVPIDPKNVLRQLLDEGIENGSVELKG